MLVGWYRAIGAFCRAVRVPLEPWQARVPGGAAGRANAAGA